MFRTLVIASVALVVFAAVLAEARPSMDDIKEQIVVEKEAVQMIAQVEEVARDVNYHAGRLADLTQISGVSSWSHYHHLDYVKALVNQGLRPALKSLKSVQAQLPEWKQESVERMIADATLLSEDASSAFIAKANGTRLPLTMNDEYKRFISAVSAHAAALVKTADAAHSYAEAHLKALEAGLSVPKARPTS